jgi:hypothetical protein
MSTEPLADPVKFFTFFVELSNPSLRGVEKTWVGNDLAV